jgi:hypothetical protein
MQGQRTGCILCYTHPGDTPASVLVSNSGLRSPEYAVSVGQLGPDGLGEKMRNGNEERKTLAPMAEREAHQL